MLQFKTHNSMVNVSRVYKKDNLLFVLVESVPSFLSLSFFDRENTRQQYEDHIMPNKSKTFDKICCHSSGCRDNHVSVFTMEK